MAYDEKLAERIRAALGARRDLTETKMFGGIAFMLSGNMAAGVMKDELMVRVAPDEWEKLLKSPGAHTMEMMKGKPAKGFIIVGGAGIDTKTKLGAWVARGATTASSMPPKATKKAGARAKKPVKKAASRKR
jgi:TfoX/Sxy family transcriptional regulator of competence genes